MSEFGQLPVYRITRSRSSKVTTGSLRSYNHRAMDDDDDFRCKLRPEYGLCSDNAVRDYAPLELPKSDDMAVNANDYISRTIFDSPATVRKKRRAPDPPSGLLGSRAKFSSIDDLLLNRKFPSAGNLSMSHSLSASPNQLNSDLWSELQGKCNLKSTSFVVSPKANKTRSNILRKLTSPMTGHKHSIKGKRVILKDNEEAGFISSSNGSSFDSPEGFTDETTVVFAVLPSDLERDVDFQVQRIPEYDKFLHELLQETDHDHQDYENLKRAADKVRSMVKEREYKLENMGNQKHMERIQDKFPYDDLQLCEVDLQPVVGPHTLCELGECGSGLPNSLIELTVDGEVVCDGRPQKKQPSSRRKSVPGAVLFKTVSKSKSANNILSLTSYGKKDTEFFHQSPLQYNNFHRQYLMEGTVEFSRGMQTQDRYLFLFSDILLVAKQKSNITFKLKYRTRVTELWISDCVDDVTELTRSKDRSFVIGWPMTNFVATFKSPELKETWLNKLKEQILEERAKFLSKTLPLEVHHTETDQTCKVDVEITTDVLSVVKKCLEDLDITEGNCRDYQLWVRVGPDESPYPLCGHELPYAIKLNQIRDYCKNPENNMSDIKIQQTVNEMQSNNRKNEFFLKCKKRQKRHSLEDNPKPKSKKISPLKNIFRKDKKKPQGKLFSQPLADVTSADMLIAKPVKELLTILFRDGPSTVGILRKSCNAKTCRELKQKLDDGEACLTIETYPPLVIGAIIKDYLRSIPHSLLKDHLFEDWVRANNITDKMEKFNTVKDTISKLTAPHYELLRHLMCVLYHIDKSSDENKMTAYNLSVCIGPSVLWPKGNQDPMATPPAIIQYMIENFTQIFGEDSIHLFGDRVEDKMRPDSGTDSDSLHSILSSHNSLDREFYSGEIDSSPSMLKSHHFSPSNLSGDSGLISDCQFYDEDGNETIKDRHFIYSTAHFACNESRDGEKLELVGHSLDGQYVQCYHASNPVPPPRRPRIKISDSPSFANAQKFNRYSSHENFIIKARYESCMNLTADRYKRWSSESLQQVEERSASASVRNNSGIESNMETLVKSTSGTHLYFKEMSAPHSHELKNLNRHMSLYKVASEGAMPVSVQSKNSLSSSYDSVLSDSSELYLNQQNSLNQNSSSPADTPEREVCEMSQWLFQDSNNISRQTHFSHDDMELGHKINEKPMNEMNYLISPRNSQKVRRDSPIPLCDRSLPLPVEAPITGNGLHSFTTAADDIIKKPDFAVTLCSQDSLDVKSEFHNNESKTPSPQLVVCNNNNNAKIVMKQLNVYPLGLQGISPPPHIVLQRLNSQTQVQRCENALLRGNNNIMNSAERCSMDAAEFTDNKQKYPMEEGSISSEDENVESESEYETFRVLTMINVPLKFDIPQKVITTDPKFSSSELPSGNSNPCNTGSVRRENLPDYAEAVHRNKLLKQGLCPDTLDFDPEILQQREVSFKAKELFEQSMREYEEQKEQYLFSSQKLERKMDVHEDDEDISDSSVSGEKKEAEFNARKLYEESLRHYNEQQQGGSPLNKTASANKSSVSVSNNREPSNKFISQSVSDVNQSHNDLANTQEKPKSPLLVNRVSNRDLTPIHRPNQPPPYNDPPPYHCKHAEHKEYSPIGTKRCIFPRSGESVDKQALRSRSPQIVFTPTLATVSNETVCKPSPKNKSQTVYVTTPTTMPSEAVNNSTVKSQSPELAEKCELTSHSQISNNNTQSASVNKQRFGVLLSSPPRNMGLVTISKDDYSNKNSTNCSKPDNTIESAQNEFGKFQSEVPNVAITVDLTNSKVKSVATGSNQSATDVFMSHSALIQQKGPRVHSIHSQNASQGPIASRNPDICKSLLEVNISSSMPTNSPKVQKALLDPAIGQSVNSAQTEFHWSVKRLSNIFDTSKSLEVSRSQCTSYSTTVSTKSVEFSSLSTRVPPPYSPPPPFERKIHKVSSSSSMRNVNSKGPDGVKKS